MNTMILTEDAVWGKALEKLSEVGNLNKFYRLSRHDLNSLMKRFNHLTTFDLGKMFKLIQEGQWPAAESFLKSLPEDRVFAMLLILGRSMKCWVESESIEDPKTIRRWKIANA